LLGDFRAASCMDCMRVRQRTNLARRPHQFSFSRYRWGIKTRARRQQTAQATPGGFSASPQASRPQPCCLAAQRPGAETRDCSEKRRTSQRRPPEGARVPGRRIQTAASVSRTSTGWGAPLPPAAHSWGSPSPASWPSVPCNTTHGNLCPRGSWCCLKRSIILHKTILGSIVVPFGTRDLL